VSLNPESVAMSSFTVGDEKSDGAEAFDAIFVDEVSIVDGVHRMMKERFEKERACIFGQLPASYRKILYTVGLCHGNPVQIISPYDLEPGALRRKWIQEFLYRRANGILHNMSFVLHDFKKHRVALEPCGLFQQSVTPIFPSKVFYEKEGGRKTQKPQFPVTLDPHRFTLVPQAGLSRNDAGNVIQGSSLPVGSRIAVLCKPNGFFYEATVHDHRGEFTLVDFASSGVSQWLPLREHQYNIIYRMENHNHHGQSLGDFATSSRRTTTAGTEISQGIPKSSGYNASTQSEKVVFKWDMSAASNNGAEKKKSQPKQKRCPPDSQLQSSLKAVDAHVTRLTEVSGCSGSSEVSRNPLQPMRLPQGNIQCSDADVHKEFSLLATEHGKVTKPARSALQKSTASTIHGNFTAASLALKDSDPFAQDRNTYHTIRGAIKPIDTAKESANGKPTSLQASTISTEVNAEVTPKRKPDLADALSLDLPVGSTTSTKPPDSKERTRARASKASQKAEQRIPKDHPKNPRSAYIFSRGEQFTKISMIVAGSVENDPGSVDYVSREQMQTLKKENGKVDMTALMKLAGQRWKNISDARAEQYKKLAAGDQKRFILEMAAFYSAKKRNLPSDIAVESNKRQMLECGKAVLTEGRQKRKKPKDAPKRYVTSFNYFTSDLRRKICTLFYASDDDVGIDNDPESFEYLSPEELEALQTVSGKMDNGAVARLVSERWARIDPARRAHYDRLVAVDMERFKKEEKEYNLKKSSNNTGDPAQSSNHETLEKIVGAHLSAAAKTSASTESDSEKPSCSDDDWLEYCEI